MPLRPNVMLSPSIKNEITRMFGRGSASFSKEDVLCYSYDATNDMHLPDGVVFPSATEEVSDILRLANREGFPVIPRGAGTGFTGGSVPVQGGVVLSLERMKRILEIDVDNFFAVVEPGVVTWEFQQEVERLGLFYPPDPSSLKFSTLGGNIAESAGGPRAVKYGVTRDYVMGLEVVMPTGEIINTGVRTAKGVVGYDLTRLMVGSEGTLGVVTKAVLRLLPLPQCTLTMLASFHDVKDAARAASQIMKAKIVPSTLELMDGVSVRAVEQYAKVGLPDAGALLLIEVDGSAETTKKEAEVIKGICLESASSEVKTATEKDAVKDLWKARRAISASLYRMRPSKINEDVVVPRSSVVDLITGIQEIARKSGLLIACFGHAGDGNVHVNIMHDKDDPKEAASAFKAVAEVFDLTLKLKGTISGEHGVGISKAPYLKMELSSEAIGLMRRIKDTFDPKGILNPGKIFRGAEGAGGLAV